jgi:replicative DNA helicase
MRMLSSVGKIDHGRVRSGQLDDDDWPKLTDAVHKIRDRNLYMDDAAGISPTEMRSRTRKLERELDEIGLIMVDYLQLMQVPEKPGQSRASQISEISRSLKAVAKEFNCPVVALSQLNRSLEDREDKRPINSDLRESGAIEQDADVIMFVYRDEVYHPETERKGEAEIIIGKSRNGEIGTVNLGFEGKYMRFDNLPQVVSLVE